LGKNENLNFEFFCTETDQSIKQIDRFGKNHYYCIKEKPENNAILWRGCQWIYVLYSHIEIDNNKSCRSYIEIQVKEKKRTGWIRKVDFDELDYVIGKVMDTCPYTTLKGLKKNQEIPWAYYKVCREDEVK